MNKYVRKRCATCDGSGMMETLNREFIQEQRDEYINTAGNTPEEILRKVRYIIKTPEAVNILDHVKKIMNRISKKELNTL